MHAHAAHGEGGIYVRECSAAIVGTEYGVVCTAGVGAASHVDVICILRVDGDALYA